MTSPFDNRRDIPRHHGNVLCLDVSHDPMPMIDMSTKGIGFIGTGFTAGETVNLWLVAAGDAKESVETLCHIVSVRGDHVAATFLDKTEKLETFIIRHITDPLFET